jgi:putative sigma-54 modulation protein
MHVELKTNAVGVIEGLRNRIDRRLRFALGKFGDRIGRVVVFLSDSNGPRGGIDKSVRVLTRIDGVGLVVAMVVDSDWTVAVDRAAHRIGQNVARSLIRQRQRKAAGIRSSDAAPLSRGR